jgi:hypothetical protein
MRKYLLTICGILLTSWAALAQSPFLQNIANKHPVFTENAGQVLDTRGNPVPEVLVKSSMPGLDLYYQNL